MLSGPDKSTLFPRVPRHGRPATGAPSNGGRRSVIAGPMRRRGVHIPGELGVWVFIIGDMAVFGLFFVTFAVYRTSALQLYAQSQRAMNQTFGVLNTVILLTSSWLVALAVEKAKRGANRVAGKLLGVAILSGAAFVSVKLLEYREKIRAGITLNTNEFFSFYYMLTGIHLLHVAIGIGVLAYLFKVVRKDNLIAADINVLEGGSAFWHLVDILWIVLFAMFYLMR
jgi:nitric oxide reductase NorE protein